VALGDEFTHHAFRVGPFGHRLDGGGAHLPAQRLLQRQAAEFVLVGPARFAHRAHIDETHLQRGGGLGQGGKRGPQAGGERTG